MRSKGRVRILLLLVALAAPLMARADQAQEDRLSQKAKDAAAAGKVFESRDAYCELAKLNANYPQATMMCKVMSDQAVKEDARCDDRYSNASADVEQKKFDDAEQKLKNIKQGCRKFEVAQDLMRRIPGLRAAAANQANEEALAKKYDQGVQAYNRNDFPAAKSLLSQVTGGPNAGAAQAQLNKIKQYEQAMAQGDQLAGAKNWKGALQAYNEAASYKSDGPGDPRGKAQRAQDSLGESEKAAAAAAAEAACRAKKPVFAAFQVSPNSGQAALTVRASANATPGCKAIAGTLIQWGDGAQTDGTSGAHVYNRPGNYDVVAWVTDEAGNKVSQTQTVRVIEAAVKQVTPEVDVAKTLAEARAAKQKGDIRLARGKYMTVLSADKTNKEALNALDELSKAAAAAPAPPPPEPQTPGVISEADALLAKGITEFYTGAFDDALVDLRNYLQFKGEKAGLANFYIGVLKATQYHLGGATDQKLAEAANESFRAAKKASKFKVPEKYVSPKIIQMYTSVAGM